MFKLDFQPIRGKNVSSNFSYWTNLNQKIGFDTRRTEDLEKIRGNKMESDPLIWSQSKYLVGSKISRRSEAIRWNQTVWSDLNQNIGSYRAHLNTMLLTGDTSVTLVINPIIPYDPICWLDGQVMSGSLCAKTPNNNKPIRTSALFLQWRNDHDHRHWRLDEEWDSEHLDR